MLTVSLLALSLAAPPVPDLADVTLADAQRLSGRPVMMTFTALAPPYTFRWRTVTGLGDGTDGIARSVVFRGDVDVSQGDRLKVAGTLELVSHPADRVNGLAIPAWKEIRISRARVVR